MFAGLPESCNDFGTAFPLGISTCDTDFTKKCVGGKADARNAMCRVEGWRFRRLIHPKWHLFKLTFEIASRKSFD